MNEALRLLLWATVGLLAAGAAAGLAAALLDAARLAPAARGAVVVAAASGAAAIILRTLETGHAPVVGNVENAMTFSWILAAAALIRVRSSSMGDPEAAAAPAGGALRTGFLAACACLLLGWGTLQGTAPAPMTSPYRSPWLGVHVLFYVLAFGALGAAAAEGVRVLSGRGAAGSDARVGRCLAFGFAAEAIGIAGGAIWAHHLWGHYWNWDPVETWSLVSWLIVGAVLHLRRSHGLAGRGLAWGAVLSFAGIAASVWGVSLLEETFHDYEAIR